MFKRFALMTLALALFSTQSFAASQNGLKDAFDELAYTMEVEGAALNPEAKQTALNHFAEAVDQLQNAGLSNQELIAFVQSQVKDQAVARELAVSYALIQSQKLSRDEMKGLMKSMSAQIYSKGASWNGEVLPIVGIVALVAIIIAISIAQGEDPCADEAYARGNEEACQDSWYNGSYYNI